MSSSDQFILEAQKVLQEGAYESLRTHWVQLQIKSRKEITVLDITACGVVIGLFFLILLTIPAGSLWVIMSALGLLVMGWLAYWWVGLIKKRYLPRFEDFSRYFNWWEELENDPEKVISALTPLMNAMKDGNLEVVNSEKFQSVIPQLLISIQKEIERGGFSTNTRANFAVRFTDCYSYLADEVRVKPGS